MPILDPATVERQLPFGPHDLGVDDADEDADGNTAWDMLLSDLLERESERIMSWVNERDNETRFEPTDETASLDGTGTDELPLPKRPVRDVASVVVEADHGTHDLTVGEDVVAEETHLVLLPDASIDRFPERRRAVDVEWTYGLDSPPGPVEDALIRLVRNALDQIKTDGLNQESINGAGSWNYRTPAALKQEAASAVRQYKPPSYYSGAQVV